MDTELMLDVGQANEFKLACRRAGWNNEDIKHLCEGDMLARLLPVVRGQAEIAVPTYVVDCDATPFIPKGCTIAPENEQIASRVRGKFALDPAKISLFLTDSQQSGRVIKGDQLRKELEGQQVLPANMLDFYLAHPHLIPELWKEKCIFFWGTVYRDSDGKLCVYALFWVGEHWGRAFLWLDNHWSSYPAAVSAS